MPAGDVPGILNRNLTEIRSRIDAACRKSGRDVGDVTLVVVTKTVPPEVIESLTHLGVSDVGENRVQALLERATALRHVGLRWHMIGHVQRNKVRRLLPAVHLIHSVDSPRLAETVDRVAGERGESAEVLIQVNISGEGAKFGLDRTAALETVRQAERWPNIRITGLMTMAPWVDDPEAVRPVFAGLRALAEDIRAEARPGVRMHHLSMGMTQDYVQAVEEGATLVRIGTAVFKGLNVP